MEWFRIEDDDEVPSVAASLPSNDDLVGALSQVPARSNATDKRDSANDTFVDIAESALPTVTKELVESLWRHSKEDLSEMCKQRALAVRDLEIF